MALVYNEKTGEFEEKPTFGSSLSSYSSSIRQQSSQTRMSYSTPETLRTPNFSQPVSLKEKILNYLRLHPNSMAKEIANALDVDRHDINHLLYGILAPKVIRDDSFRWRLK